MGILQEGSEYELHEIAPGIRGRKLPPRELKQEDVDKVALLCRESGGKPFEDFVRNLYAPELARQKRRSFIQSLFKR